MKSLFVLKRQPLREQDWLLDVFTSEQGRLSLVQQNPHSGAEQDAEPPLEVDLFQRCQGDWQNKGSWPRLRGLQCQHRYSLQGRHLYCAFYLNELLIRLLPQHEPHPNLYALYQQILTALESAELAEPWLRLFENQLLQDLGYGFSWTRDNRQQALNAEDHYAFDAQQGFILQARQQAGFQGKSLLAFAAWQQDFANIPTDVNVWNVAKRVLRQALENILERPLVSRELFHAPAYSGQSNKRKRNSDEPG